MPHATLNPPASAYSTKAFADKEKAKIEFCEAYDLSYDRKIPLFAITHPLTDKNRVELLKAAMPGLLQLPLKLALAGIGTQTYQDYFSALAGSHPNQLVIVNSSPEDKAGLLAAADVAVISGDSKECREAAQDAQRAGVIPIAPMLDGLMDYNPVRETGNAFLFAEESPWLLFAAVVRALENFRFPYDWKTIQEAGLPE